ncbi:hypothetical protein DFJ58DRAFT_755650 [Suillus subalutaceus]|uniref:uncharacterized protein n=1 Tax=Suillus subalutaceus TaxID=48586 RepID=UPI001B885B15|nr:uncharacterized protein DFJ58DRAFT_755650 [Suillus subalutaceus]KAG1876668.1 hypothetical protein DFJ58DRAFT_755650 [Suillus subalutaceus]
MDQYGEPSVLVPHSDAYNAPAPATATSETRDQDAAPPRGRSRSRSPGARSTGYLSPPQKVSSPPPKSQYMLQLYVPHVSKAPNPSQVFGVFRLSIRIQERYLNEEFSRFGRELNGRRIRVDYSVTDKPHAPTLGKLMGRRCDSYHRDSYRDSYRDRDKDRNPYGRDSRDWRDRRSPRRYSPDYRRHGSYSRSPPRGSSPRKDCDGPSGTGVANSSNQAENGSRWY